MAGAPIFNCNVIDTYTDQRTHITNTLVIIPVRI